MGFASAFTASFASISDLPNENLATQRLAAILHSSGVRSFWTADSIWPFLGGASLRKSWKGSKAYDLSWAAARDAQTPSFIAQVKIGTKTQEDQEVLLFLGDLAFAALDYAPTVRRAFAIAVIPTSRSTEYWSRLVPASGTSMTLHLEPSLAAATYARGAAWIDPQAGRIAPTTQSQYSKIFGAGTNAKFVGLFKRPGAVSITSTVSQASSGPFSIIVYEVQSLSFHGPGDLESWWP